MSAKKSFSIPLKTVLAGNVALAKLASLELTIDGAEHIMRLQKHVAPLVEEFFQNRRELIEECGTLIAEDQWDLGEKKDEFMTRIQTLVDEDVRIPLDVTIKKSDLDGVRICAADLGVLSYAFSDLD